MSGYLARLVRRHVEPAPVRPRHELRLPWAQPPQTPADHVPAPAQRRSVAHSESRGEAPASASTPAPVEAMTNPEAASPDLVAPFFEPARLTAADSPVAQADVARVAPASRSLPVVQDARDAIPVAERTAAATPEENPVAAWGTMEPPPEVPMRRAAPRHAALTTTRPTVARSEPTEPRVVRIHIGRVDVRAVMPAASPSAPPRPSRPSPALSLDQYLAGKRRP